MTDFRLTKNVALYKETIQWKLLKRRTMQQLKVIDGTSILLSPINIEPFRDLTYGSLFRNTNVGYNISSPYFDLANEKEIAEDNKNRFDAWSKYIQIILKQRMDGILDPTLYLMLSNAVSPFDTEERRNEKINQVMMEYERIKTLNTTTTTSIITTTNIPTTIPSTTTIPLLNGSIQLSMIESYISIQNNADNFDILGVDYTIEWFQYRTDYANVVTFYNNNVIACGLEYHNDTYDKIRLLLDGSNIEMFVPKLFKLNEWQHFAISVVSNSKESDNKSDYYIYVNGNPLLEGWSDYKTTKSPTSDFIIGNTDKIVNGFGGLITNFRFTKGEALYTTSTFTVPSIPLVSTENTTLLLAPTNKKPANDLTNKNIINLVNTRWEDKLPSPIVPTTT
jgi:hypothetical protein